MKSDHLELVFATNNLHKLKEIKSMLKSTFTILSLKDIGCDDDLPETSATITGNALQKAGYVFEKYGMNCFADDTGLEIEALDGRPGVYSARFAGLTASYEENVLKVLTELKGQINRKAKFKTVIALITENERRTFEGVIKGEITTEPRGSSGFGYDPVFVPEGSEKTFAEMTEEEKNKISHRGKAFALLVDYLGQGNIKM